MNVFCGSQDEARQKAFAKARITKISWVQGELSQVLKVTLDLLQLRSLLDAPSLALSEQMMVPPRTERVVDGNSDWCLIEVGVEEGSSGAAPMNTHFHCALR